MVYCMKCGKKIDDDAFFCPTCGARTKAGAAAGAGSPFDDVREAIAKAGKEMEKALAKAAKEMEDAIKSIHENAKEALKEKTTTCPSCKEANPSSASYCSKCGAKLTD